MRKKILNEYEIFFIEKYNLLIPNGYNIEIGGNLASLLCKEKNPNAKLTEEDVYNIRESYKNHELSKSDVYENYKDIVSSNTFADVWLGKTWKGIHMDVYTIENKVAHKRQNNKKHFGVITEDEIRFIRDCKNNGMTKSEVIDKYFPNINYNTFSDIWYNNTFKKIISDLEPKSPSVEDTYKNRSGCNNHLAKFSEDQVRAILNRKKNGESIRIVHRDYSNFSRHCFSNLWHGKTYKELYKQICND